MRLAVAASFCLVSLAGSACSGVIDPSKNRDETFSGTLGLGGAVFHEFDSRNGEYDVRLTSVIPASTVYVGLGWGRVLNGNCQLEYNNNFGQVNRTALAGPVTSGRYCVLVYDSGALSETITYAVRVSRP